MDGRESKERRERRKEGNEGIESPSAIKEQTLQQTARKENFRDSPLEGCCVSGGHDL